MKIAFVIYTPGQTHFWHFPILKVEEKGHRVLVLARDDGLTCELLHSHGIQFIAFGKAGKTRASKVAQLPLHFLKSFAIIKGFQPDIIIGVGLIEAYSAFLLRKPCIIFEDSEPTPSLERSQWKRLANIILTPESLSIDLGKKQIRFAGYKELAYLHPNYFRPDPTIYDELNIKRDEKYIILRFNVFDAVHDIRRRGFSASDQIKLVNELEKYARVFISPECQLPRELEDRRLPITYERIHQVLYYAHMLVSDTGTMTTEAAILGTPSIICLSNAYQFGNFVELEYKYDLLYAFSKPKEAIEKAIKLMQQPDLKEQWAKKRQRLLTDKIDVTQFIVEFIENYPESSKKYQRKENLL